MTWQYTLKKHQPILKAKPTKKAKKGAAKVTEGGDSLMVISTASLNKVTSDLLNWETTCKGLSGDAIGVTGKGWSGHGNQLSLYDHVIAHVDSSINLLQRPGQGEKVGAMDTINKVMELTKENKAFKEKELRLVDNLIEDLEAVEGSPKTNPQNIPFNVPEEWTETELEKKKEVFGHYRTPNYVKFRRDVRNKDEQDAVDSGWYSDSPDTAEPPFWQALFNRGGSGLVGEGILPILERFKEEMEEQELEKLHVKGRFQREDIERLPPFIGALKATLKEQDVYHSTDVPFKRLTINFAALKRKLAVIEFQLSSEAESDFVKKVTGHEDLIGELTSFYIDNISLRLLRTIIKNNIDLDKFKHGEHTGIFLQDAIRVREPRKDLIAIETNKARKEGKLPGWIREDKKPEDKKPDKNPNVKKSWGMIIRRGLV
jgi:hypothetical protein